MEGEGVGRETERFGHTTCCHAFGAGLDQKPEYIEAVFLCEGRQGCYGGYFFHISTNIEILSERQGIANDLESVRTQTVR